MISKNIKPYFIDYNRYGDILFLYKFNANTKNRGKIYVKAFNNKKNRWSSAVNLKFENESTKILNFLIDSMDKVHFIFKENNSVKYLGQHFNDFNNMIGSLQLDDQISLGDMASTDYHLFEVDVSLWISWKTNSKLYHLCPTNQANGWTERALFESNEIFNVKYLGSHYKDKSFSKALVTFGVNRNNEAFILGLDDDFLAQEDTKINELNNDIDKTWYGGDDEISDLVDETFSEDEVDKMENDIFYEDEKDLTTENEKGNNEAEVMEPASCIDTEFQQDKEAEDINISNNESLEDRCIVPVEIEDSEKVDNDIVNESQHDEVKDSTKKSFFTRMKDFLTSD